MDRNAILQRLHDHLSTPITEFDVETLALLAPLPVAREDSDIDILISFKRPATSARYFGLQFYLEDLLHHPIDLVTDKALRPELRSYIEREALHV
uniref:nucleotidyltransferase family protein n=1 Tax=Halomonas sp. TaxID=1486246 RepID=UPI002606539F|nr:nucleotidyltransferase domain-containing protein [Halomonas sp.]